MKPLPPAHDAPPVAALVELLRSGQMEALAHQAQACAVRWPGSGPVWHLLGLAYLNLGRPGEAVEPLAKAGKLLPRAADVAEHLAIAFMQAGRAREAYRAFQRCLALAPGEAHVRINLAHLANELGEHSQAQEHCRQVLRRAPGQAEALFNLGRALRGLGKHEEAIAAFRQVLAGAKDSPVAHNDVGLQLQDLGARGEAEACFRRAIALAPDYARAHSNLGRMLQDQGRPDEALAALRQAVALEPGLAPAHANLAGLLNSMRMFEEGEAACRQALRLDPAQVGALANRGTALLGLRRNAEAEACFRQALALDPDHADSCNNLGNLLAQEKRYEEALPLYRRIKGDGSALAAAYHCASHLCDWKERSRDEAALRRMLQSDVAAPAPFHLLAMPGEDGPALQRRAGLLYANRHFPAELARPPMVDPSRRPTRDRLRIAYLSADFHDHATMHLLAGVLAAHDRARYFIQCYSYGPDIHDRGRQQALDAAEIFRDFGAMSDRAAAEQIAADGIDILVDLKGYTQDGRLGISALRPAPLIVSWLGYPGTLGHQRLADYIVGDPIVTPPDHAPRYSEALASMPHSYQPNDRGREIGNRPSRRDAGLPDEGFVFCSFNQSYKLSPTLFDRWCRLLRGVPGSVLWLLRPAAAAVANLRAEAGKRGVEAERLIFAEHLPVSEHLGRLQLADLALDTFPYGSHTTGSDALWVGVPMVTMLGETFASRVGASLLHAAGLPELVAESWEAYEALAQGLAMDPPRLAALREQLGAQRLTAPLFDTLAFARDLERLYEAIWTAPHGAQVVIAASPRG